MLPHRPGITSSLYSSFNFDRPVLWPVRQIPNPRSFEEHGAGIKEPPSVLKLSSSLSLCFSSPKPTEPWTDQISTFSSSCLSFAASVSVKLVSISDLWPSEPGLPGPAGRAELPVEYIKDTPRSAFLNSHLADPQYLFLVALNSQHVRGSS